MYCKRCGMQIPNEADFCPNCGVRTAKSDFSTSARRRPSISRSNRIIAAITSVALVLVVGIICFTIVMKGKQDAQLAAAQAAVLSAAAQQQQAAEEAKDQPKTEQKPAAQNPAAKADSSDNTSAPKDDAAANEAKTDDSGTAASDDTASDSSKPAASNTGAATGNEADSSNNAAVTAKPSAPATTTKPSTPATTTKPSAPATATKPNTSNATSNSGSSSSSNTTSNSGSSQPQYNSAGSNDKTNLNNNDENAAASKPTASNYLWPTDTAYISNADLRTMSKDTVAAVRNEIYARHGYAFTTARWQSYFSAKTWYHRDNACTQAVIDARLSALERRNIETIVAYEESQGWR